MSNDTCGQDPGDRQFREAARWMMRLQQPDLSPRLLVRWSKWQESAENRAAFDALEPIWRALQPPGDNVESTSDQTTPPAELNDPEMFERRSERLQLVSEEAAYWYLLCIDDPHTLRSDRREFLAWLRRSPENIAELLKIAQLGGTLRKLRRTLRSARLTSAGVDDSPPWRSTIKLHRAVDEGSTGSAIASLKLAGIAAAALIGVAVAFVTHQYWESTSIITTGASQWHNMTLADGTAVHVDARSKLEIEYTDAARVVRVHEGSAVFEVAKDPKRPFIARTHLLDAMAVGTRFCVSVDDAVTTTVAEGVVQVTGRDNLNGKAVTLKAGEELRVSGDALTAPRFSRVDAQRKLQWASGLLDLGGMTVSAAAQELNRRNRTQIVVDSPTLAARVIEVASVKVDSPESYAKAVAAEPGVKMILDEEHGQIRLSE
jgi:transmembrane sensor